MDRVRNYYRQPDVRRFIFLLVCCLTIIKKWIILKEPGGTQKNGEWYTAPAAAVFSKK